MTWADLLRVTRQSVRFAGPLGDMTEKPPSAADDLKYAIVEALENLKVIEDGDYSDLRGFKLDEALATADAILSILPRWTAEAPE